MPRYDQPTLEHTIELEPIQCPGCFMYLALTVPTLAELEHDGRTFWCPNGCPMHFHATVDEEGKRSSADLSRGEAP